MTKRATTRAEHTVGRIVAAVYRKGGVTRREAMVGYYHTGLRNGVVLEQRREEIGMGINDCYDVDPRA